MNIENNIYIIIYNTYKASYRVSMSLLPYLSSLWRHWDIFLAHHRQRLSVTLLLQRPRVVFKT